MASSPNQGVTGVVQLQISLTTDQGERYKEIVRRKTKRHELVEADGFVFRRKRAALTPPSAKAATPAQQPGTTPHANPAGAAAALVPALQLDAAPTRSPARPGASLRTDQAASLDEEGLAAAECTATPEQQQQQPDATEQEQLMAQQETQQGGPLRFTMLPSELCDLVEWVVLDEARKLTGSAPEEARSAAAALRAAFASSLESWQRSDAATATDGAAQLVVLPYLVERKQAELRDKHARQGYSVT